MILYKTPEFSCHKSYYSLFSSVLMFFVSLHVKNYIALIVSLFSIVHHCRSYEDDYNDI